MAGIYDTFKTDNQLETSGVWLEYGETDNGDPVRILVSRACPRNVAYTKALEKATRPHRQALQHDAMSEAQSSAILREVYADTIILGWEGVTGPDSYNFV